MPTHKQPPPLSPPLSPPPPPLLCCDVDDAGLLTTLSPLSAHAHTQEAAPSSLPAKQLPGGLIVPGSGGMAAAGGGAGAGAGASEANPEEISLDDSADAGADVAVVDVEQKSVPAGVFGDAKKLAEQQAAEKAAAEEPVGALDRFKKRRLA